jgi:hypothetical protein
MVVGFTRAMAARLVIVAAALVALAMVRVPRPPTLCLLRGTTGIPCPFCGFTTSCVRMGHGDFAGALHASPLAVAACVGFVALPFVRSRLMGRWNKLPHKWRQVGSPTVILMALTMSELWQLVRYGVI